MKYKEVVAPVATRNTTKMSQPNFPKHLPLIYCQAKSKVMGNSKRKWSCIRVYKYVVDVYKQSEHLSDINYRNKALSMYFITINALPLNTSCCWPKCWYTLCNIWETKNVIETSKALLMDTQAYVHTFFPLFSIIS